MLSLSRLRQISSILESDFPSINSYQEDSAEKLYQCMIRLKVAPFSNVLFTSFCL